MEYFERKWPEDWVAGARHKVEVFYNQHKTIVDSTFDIEKNSGDTGNADNNEGEGLRSGRLMSRYRIMVRALSLHRNALKVVCQCTL